MTREQLSESMQILVWLFNQHSAACDRCAQQLSIYDNTEREKSSAWREAAMTVESALTDPDWLGKMQRERQIVETE